MNKEKIKEFFNRYASGWDEDMAKDDEIMDLILDRAEVSEGKDVLDVACGTGVMIDYYLKRGVRSVTGIDLSDRMCGIAEGKFHDGNVRIICVDAEEYQSGDRYDAIVIYNAFPHFCDGEKLIGNLSALLREDGILSVAHGMSRERVNGHHSNVSKEIKCDLPEAEDLAKVFAKYLDVTVVVSDERMYQVAGRKKEK